MAATLTRFAVNVGGKKPRREKLEGRDHLVAPARILKEAVLNGSGGPGFYPHEENSKNPACWNHMPMVVDHPAVNGTPVSARTPDVLNSRKIGVVLNSAVSAADKAVDVECWFDIEATKAVDNRIFKKIENGEQVECSTGLFLNQDPVSGKFGDDPYNWIARDQTPDHLAILPDKVGALSVKMGGGLFANAEKEPESHLLVQQRTAENALKGVGIEMVGNELSFNTITRQLADVLSNSYGEKGKYWEGWPLDVFSDHVIFNDGKGKTLRQEYTATDKGVSLSGKAVEVVRTVSYKPVTGNAAGDLTPTKETKQMDKTATVNSLIQTGGYAESDRAWLTALPDDALKNIKPVTVNAAPAAVPPPVVLPPGTQITREQIAAVMGPNWMHVYNYGETQLVQRRTMLINALKQTGRCPFTDDALGKMEPSQLEAMCQLAGVVPGQAAAPIGNGSPFVPGYNPGWAFGGMPGGMPIQHQPTGYLLNAGNPPAGAGAGGGAGGGNGGDVDDSEPLDYPVVNGFSTKKKAG